MKKDNQVVFQFLSEPTDVNYGGKVHGGAVMKWIDQVGYSCASMWSGTYCVTVYVGGIRFFRPIHIGDMVKVIAKIIHTGNSSMHIAVDVYSKKVTEVDYKKKTHCIIVFSALDEGGVKTTVPKWLPETDEEKRLAEHAIRLVKMREEINKEMAPFMNGE